MSRCQPPKLLTTHRYVFIYFVLDKLNYFLNHTGKKHSKNMVLRVIAFWIFWNHRVKRTDFVKVSKGINIHETKWLYLFFNAYM